MKLPLFSGLKYLSPLFIAIFSFFISQAQPPNSKSRNIDWDKDTISADATISSAIKYRTDLNNAGKKASKIVILPVDKLKDIMDACYANGVTEVKAVFVTIRSEDVENYSSRHSGMSAAEKRDVIGRQTLVLRVPRKAFLESGSKITIPNNNPLMLSLLAAGLVVMEVPMKDLAGSGDDIYFEFGAICPPPNSCD